MTSYGSFPLKFSYHKKEDVYLSIVPSPPVMQMQTAFEHFNEQRNTLKMTTGSPDMDSLIDSIQEGQFYLLYETNRAILDEIGSWAPVPRSWLLTLSA